MEVAKIEQLIKQLVKEQLQNNPGAETKSAASLSVAPSKSGIFQTVDEAIAAAKIAQKAYSRLRICERKKAVEAIRQFSRPNAEKMAKWAHEETGLGRAEDKIAKNLLAIDETPGVEDLTTSVQTGDHGMTLYELSPFGVIGAITPSTNPSETIISNAIGMIAAGNSIYFNPHPGAKGLCLWLIEELNKAIKEAIGIDNLIVSVAAPNIETANEMMNHKDVSLLAVTGGSGVVKAAMKTGKKTIGAGAGNPPVIVDETADIEKAAKDIVTGASFDNNVLCIAEKSVMVLEQVADFLLFQMEKNNAFHVKCPQDIQKLIDTCTIEGKKMNPKFIGKDACVILEAAGIKCDFTPRLIIFETTKCNPFAVLEQLMPVLPIIRVKDFQEALDTALEIEKGYGHTAIMHSQNISRLNIAARDMMTSIFVKNGPSYAGLGFQGEGPATFTIATPSGEGTTTARHFTRMRRCVLTDGFTIR